MFLGTNEPWKRASSVVAPRLGFVLYGGTATCLAASQHNSCAQSGISRAGDPNTLSQADQQLLRCARDEVKVPI